MPINDKQNTASEQVWCMVRRRGRVGGGTEGGGKRVDSASNVVFAQGGLAEE